MTGHFEIRQASSGHFYFILHAADGEPILTSEIYSDRQGASNGIQAVKVYCPDDARYIRKTSTRELYFFLLTSINGTVIGRSAEYASMPVRENGINALKALAPAAPVVERAQ
jgi:uncharacterized protein YegP (UPF0339 family)